ncbi:type II secretion system protein [bacterium]|nr:type II secretion system protein [bacterium]
MIEEQRTRGQEGKQETSLNKTLSRICKFAYCSLTNSTLSQRERVKHAFTLAEVLITLGIIGVVAAMTMPTLIQKHQERVTVNKVKKFYSVISQAQLLAIKDHGYLDEWDVPDRATKKSAEKFMSYLTPYLKIAKDCGTSSGCLQNGTVKLLNGNNWVNYDSQNGYYKLILNDGTYMWLRSSTDVYCGVSGSGTPEICGGVWIDINGKNPPNTIGRDVFSFAITKNSITRPDSNDCKSDAAGWSCTNWILEKGDMDYLKK